QCVERGTLLGYSGQTGHVTGSHLHYAVYYYGDGWLNPEDFLNEDGPPDQVVAPHTGRTLMLGPPPSFDLAALLNGPKPSGTANAADPNIPVIDGSTKVGGYWVISARQLTADESHFNAARVQGYVFDSSYMPKVGIPMRVCWSGGCMNTQTRSN